MIEIIQIIPAVTDLYAVWEESNGTSYSVDRAYYLGWDVSGDISPLVIDKNGRLKTSTYHEYMLFDWNGYQWWKRHKADMPVNECFNRFEREQREKNIESFKKFFNGEIGKENK